MAAIQLTESKKATVRKEQVNHFQTTNPEIWRERREVGYFGLSANSIQHKHQNEHWLAPPKHVVPERRNYDKKS